MTNDRQIPRVPKSPFKAFLVFCINPIFMVIWAYFLCKLIDSDSLIYWTLLFIPLFPMHFIIYNQNPYDAITDLWRLPIDMKNYELEALAFIELTKANQSEREYKQTLEG